MSAWIESSSESPSPPAAPSQQYMSGISRAPRYCEPNDGHIDVINDYDEDENYANLINELEKEKKKATSKTKGKKKPRKSNDSQESIESKVSQLQQALKLKPPVLPFAPLNPAVPATLSSRLKRRHHPGGWHGRTIAESKAAEMLQSKIDPKAGDLTFWVTKFIASSSSTQSSVEKSPDYQQTVASETTLKLIAKDNFDTIKAVLMDLVKEFNATRPEGTYKIRYELIEIKDGVNDGKKDNKESKQEGDESKVEATEYNRFTREQLERISAGINERLAAHTNQTAGSSKRKQVDDDIEDDTEDDMENGMEVDMFM